MDAGSDSNERARTVLAYALVDALRSAESSAYWFGSTLMGGVSVFAQNVGATVLFVLWTAIILTLFYRPATES